jgi:hypothetical protein
MAIVGTNNNRMVVLPPLAVIVGLNEHTSKYRRFQSGPRPVGVLLRDAINERVKYYYGAVQSTAVNCHSVSEPAGLRLPPIRNSIVGKLIECSAGFSATIRRTKLSRND